MDHYLDSSEAARFIEALTGSANTPVTFQTFTDSDARPKPQPDPLAAMLHGTLAERLPELRRRSAQGAGVYVTINATDLHGRTKANVTSVRAYFVDFDAKDGQHPPDAWAVAPSVLVRTGGGFHAYWLAALGETLDDFTPTQKQLTRALKSDPNPTDLPRVMRLPGFPHLKDATNPRPVTIELCEPGRRYTAAELRRTYPAPFDAMPTIAVDEAAAQAAIAATPPDERLRRASAYLNKLGPIDWAQYGEGTGDTHAFRAACAGHDFGVDAEDWWPVLRDWGRTCKPPPPEPDLRAKLAGVYDKGYAQRPAGCLLVKPAVETTARRKLQLTPVGDYIMKHANTREEWLVPGWVARKSIAFMVGKPGSYKTWMLTDLAVAVAMGKPFLDVKPDRQGPILMFQQEDPHSPMSERVAMVIMAKAHPDGVSMVDEGSGVFRITLPPTPDPPILVHEDRGLSFDDHDAVAELEQLISEHRPALVIMDPFYSLGALGDDHGRTLVTEKMRVLKRLTQEYDVSFLIVHHAGHAASDRMWGSVFLEAFRESTITLEKSGKCGTTVKVKRYHKITAPLDDITVRFDITPERYSAQVVSLLPTEKESAAVVSPPRVEPPGAMSFRAAAASVVAEHGADLPSAEAIEHIRALGVRGRDGADPKDSALKAAWRSARRANTTNEHGEHEHPTAP
jgi:hypothetical protein